MSFVKEFVEEVEQEREKRRKRLFYKKMLQSLVIISISIIFIYIFFKPIILW